MSDKLERISCALQFIDPTDRDIWLRMGMAVKSDLGEAGFDAWEAWSQLAESFNGKDARDVWKSIRADGAVTVASLFHEAKSNGWRDDATPHVPTPEELAERGLLAPVRAAREEAEIARQRDDTARKSTAILAAATEATADNPYLSCKQVSPVPTLREIDADAAAAILGYVPRSGGEALVGRLLVVPVTQGEGVSTLELIDGSGRKAALAGRGTKAGGYWATERLPDGNGNGLTLLIGEGVATVLSAKLASGHPGVAALSAGNLRAVATKLRQRHPEAAIVILADLVKATGKPDRHAVESAQLVGGTLAIPEFGIDRSSDLTDFNDMARTCGAEAVKHAIAAAGLTELEVELSGKRNVAPSKGASTVDLTRASAIAIEPIEWLWEGWLAAGKMHLLGGAPGTGKTTISMGLAAIVTNGGRWPDGSRSVAGNVVIWSGEDDPADTLIPRLALSGADRDRVYFISGTKQGEARRSFDPAQDMELLRHRLAGIGGVRLLIVDPIVSAIAGDSHKNAEVRRGLQPLVDLAASMRCALLGITHFSKGTGGRDPVERLTGSLAFAALARVVLIAAKHQEEREDGRVVRLFCRAKSNIGPDDGGFEYDLREAELNDHPGIFASSVQWGRPVDGAARELLAAAEAFSGDGEGGTLSDEKRFLRDLLKDGPLPTKTIQSDADGAGFSWASIRRAQKPLGIKPIKTAMNGGWVWQMPGQPDAIALPPNAKVLQDTEGAQQKCVSPFADIAHLRDEASLCPF